MTRGRVRQGGGGKLKRETVCLSVRVTPEQAAAFEAWCRGRGVTIQRALERVVAGFVEHGPADDARRALLVTAEEAHRGGAATHPLRVLVERHASE